MDNDIKWINEYKDSESMKNFRLHIDWINRNMFNILFKPILISKLDLREGKDECENRTQN